MKVYISGYGHRFTAYRFQDWYMERKYGLDKYWGMEDTEYDAKDKFVEKLVDGIQIILDKTINKLTDRERKIKVRIDSYDTWSMDHTLALIIHPMLVQLKATNHGYGYVDPDDVPHIGKGEEVENAHDGLTQQRWNWFMDELIWTFEQLKNDDSYELFYTEENGWNREAMDAHEERIKNGLRLFGKYFRALWD